MLWRLFFWCWTSSKDAHASFNNVCIHSSISGLYGASILYIAGRPIRPQFFLLQGSFSLHTSHFTMLNLIMRFNPSDIPDFSFSSNVFCGWTKPVHNETDRRKLSWDGKIIDLWSETFCGRTDRGHIHNNNPQKLKR